MLTFSFGHMLSLIYNEKEHLARRAAKQMLWGDRSSQKLARGWLESLSAYDKFLGKADEVKDHSD